MAPFQLSDLNVTTFATCDAETKKTFEKFVRGLTLTLDNEPGDDPEKGTWVWVQEEDATMSANLPYATFIFRGKDSGDILATASFVHDDRGQAEKLGLAGSEEFLGIWGFFLVQRDIRGRGLGKIISKYVDEHVQRYVDSIGKPKVVYLFSANEYAVRIYESLGFARAEGSVNLPEFGFEEPLYAKRYEPRPAAVEAPRLDLISAQDLPAAIATGKPPLVLVVSASWCPACRMLAPVMEKLAFEFGGKLQFRKLDADENRDFLRKHGIKTIPHVMCYNDGHLVCETGDAEDYLQQREWIETFALEHASTSTAETSPAEQTFANAVQAAGGVYETALVPAEAAYERGAGPIEEQLEQLSEALQDQVASGEISRDDAKAKMQAKREELMPLLQPHRDAYKAIARPAEEQYIASVRAATSAWIAANQA